MAKRVAKLMLDVEYDDDKTDAESVASALDTLLETALSTPGILDEYGAVEIGVFDLHGDRPVVKVCPWCGGQSSTWVYVGPGDYHYDGRPLVGGDVCTCCYEERPIKRPLLPTAFKD